MNCFFDVFFEVKNEYGLIDFYFGYEFVGNCIGVFGVGFKDGYEMFKVLWDEI